MTLKIDIENIDLKTVPFAEHVLKTFDKIEYEIFESRFGSVDLSKVIGCEHPDYAGKSWGNLRPVPRIKMNDNHISYQILKRGDSNLRDLANNPDYYLNDSQKHHWDFYELDGQYYISCGVHRTIIARFFFFYNDIEPLVSGVRIFGAKKKISKPAMLEHKIEKSIWQKIKEFIKT